MNNVTQTLFHTTITESIISFCDTYADYPTNFVTNDYRIRKALTVIEQMIEDQFLIESNVSRALKVETIGTNNTQKNEDLKSNSTQNKSATTTNTSTTDGVDEAQTFTYPDGTLSTVDHAYISGSANNSNETHSSTDNTAVDDTVTENTADNKVTTTVDGVSTVTTESFDTDLMKLNLNFMTKILDIFELALLSLQATIWS